MEQILSNIAAVVTLSFILGGVVLVLLVIHFLSTYFRGEEKGRRLQDDLRELRYEAGNSEGVSRHSLFYSFFFREK